jgi:Outer membrane protein beta-barrel domain
LRAFCASSGVEGHRGPLTPLVILSLLLCATPGASAQERSTAAATIPRADISGVTGWLEHHVRGERLDGDDWNNRWYGGTQLGYYWTEHLKTELEIGLTNEGESWAAYPVSVSRRSTPVAFTKESRRQRDVTISVGQSWQFFRNQWVHPFVGAGIDANYARVRRELHTFDPSDAGLPQITRLEDERWHAALHGIGGVKMYFTTRSFVRFDGRVSFGQDGQHVVWRVGLGWDF